MSLKYSLPLIVPVSDGPRSREDLIQSYKLSSDQLSRLAQHDPDEAYRIQVEQDLLEEGPRD